MSVPVILLVVIVLLAVGVFPAWPHARNWNYGYYPTGGLTLVAAVIILLLLMGRI